MGEVVCVVIGNSAVERNTGNNTAISFLLTFTTRTHPTTSCPTIFEKYSSDKFLETSLKHTICYYATLDEFPVEEYSNVDTFMLTLHGEDEKAFDIVIRDYAPRIRKNAPRASLIFVPLEDHAGDLCPRHGVLRTQVLERYLESKVIGCSTLRFERNGKGYIDDAFKEALVPKEVKRFEHKRLNDGKPPTIFLRDIVDSQCLAFFGDHLYVGTSGGVLIFLLVEDEEEKGHAIIPKLPPTERSVEGGVSAMAFLGCTLFLIGGNVPVLMEMSVNTLEVKKSGRDSLLNNICGIAAFGKTLYVSSFSPPRVNVFYSDGSLVVWSLPKSSGTKFPMALFYDELLVGDQFRHTISRVSEQKCEDILTRPTESLAMACMGDELYFFDSGNGLLSLDYEGNETKYPQEFSAPSSIAFRGGDCFIADKGAQAVFILTAPRRWKTFPLEGSERPPHSFTPFSSLCLSPAVQWQDMLVSSLPMDHNLAFLNLGSSRYGFPYDAFAKTISTNQTLQTIKLRGGLQSSTVQIFIDSMSTNNTLTRIDYAFENTESAHILNLLCLLNDRSALEGNFSKIIQQVPNLAYEKLRSSSLRSLKFACKLDSALVREAFEWQLAFRLGLWGNPESKTATGDLPGEVKLTLITDKKGIITPPMLPVGKRGSVLTQWLAHFSDMLSSHKEHKVTLREKILGKKSMNAEGYEYKDVAVSSSRIALLTAVVEQHPELFAVNSRDRNYEGISYYDSCNRTLRNIIDEVLLFCGTYRLISTMPEHKSDTCCILRALEESSDKTVVLKLMINQDQFQREIDQRKGLDDSCVLSALDSSTRQQRWAQDVARFLKLPHQHGIVLEAAQRNLMVVLLQERLRIDDIKEMFNALIRCVRHMHAANRVHADLKPLNMVRMNDGTWRLIDLDATVNIGEVIGVKTSTAYCPPELHELDPDGMFHLVPLQASPSFDLWSMGCVLFRALARKPLLEADDRDNLRGMREKCQLSEWGHDVLTSALAELSSALRAEAEEKKEGNRSSVILAALDLVGWLLQRDPQLRPTSCEQVLEHSFLRENGCWFMSPLHCAAGIGDVRGVLAAPAEVLSSVKHTVAKTPLHLAAEEGHIDTVKALLSRGASLIITDAQGNNVLQSVINLLNDERSTNHLLHICRCLCEVADLSLLDGSEPRRTTLELGRSCRNRHVRKMFEEEIIELQLFGALKSRPPQSITIADFNKVWNRACMETQVSLKTTVISLLNDWGLQRYEGANWSDPRSWKAWHAECALRHDYVRKLILPLACWKIQANFVELQQLAKTKARAGLADMFVVRDRLFETAPALRELETFGYALTSQLDVAESLLKCTGGAHADQQAIDEKVLVPLVQLAASGLHARFKQRLFACLSDPPELREVHATETLDTNWSRWIAVAPVKGTARVIAKMGENKAEAEAKRSPFAWPYVSSLGDTLRAMVVCRDASTLHDTWTRLNDEFCVEQEGRLKNNFRDAGLCTKELPPDMLMNAVLREPSFLPLVVEIQVHHVEILALKEFEQHLFYEITRASSSIDFEPRQ